MLVTFEHVPYQSRNAKALDYLPHPRILLHLHLFPAPHFERRLSKKAVAKVKLFYPLSCLDNLYKSVSHRPR